MRRKFVAGVFAGLILAATAEAQVTRVGPESAAVSDAVSIRGPSDTLYVSGITPPGTAPNFGDTKAQTAGILKRIEEILKAQGYGMGDIAMMRVYLVADPAKGGKMDFAGMMEAFKQFFGTPAQPKKPARATIQVAALVDQGQLVEIEVQAVRPHK